MSWFSDFLTDVSGPIGKSAQAGMINQENRNRDLETMRKHIPIMVEQQKALLPGQIERETAGRQAGWDNAFRTMLVQHRLNMDRDAAKRPVPPQEKPTEVARGDLADYISNPGSVNVPWNADFGHEGQVPSGGTPVEKALDPRKVESLGVRAGMQTGPLMERLFPQLKPAPPSNTRSSGLTNSRIQAGLELGYGTDVSSWGPNEWKQAALKEIEHKHGGAINVDRGLWNTAKDKYPNDPDMALNEFYRLLGGRSATVSRATAEGPTMSSAPVPYPGAGQPSASPRPSPSGSVGTQLSGDMTPDEQERLARMSPAERSSFLKGRGTAAGAVTKDVSKEISKFERAEMLIDQLDAMSKPLITAKTPAEVGVQWAKRTVGGITRMDQGASLYQQTVEQFLGQLARQVSSEVGVLTDPDITRVRNGMPNFKDTVAIRDGKIALLKNMLQVNKAAEESRLANGGRLTPEQRTVFRSKIDTVMRAFDSPESISPPQASVPKLDPEGLAVVRGAPAGKTFTIGGKTYTREQLLGEQ